ncbi:MAG TPA: plastocyanin/azurin family copper-binding protein, partial [Saprospiraceae bacterium]|nr:plastocyanin/azurin family copper-binding protein [Saprospiraceae bacterium]
WVNNDDEVHTATSDFGEGGWNTGDIPPGSAKSITFYTIGTYPYHCVYHASKGMRGTIIVQ